MITRKGYNSTLLQVVMPLVATVLYDQGAVGGVNRGAQNSYINRIIVCNNGGVATTLSIGIAIGGDAINQAKQYMYKDLPIDANDTFALDMEIGLVKGERIFGYAGNANLSLQMIGSNEQFTGH